MKVSLFGKNRKTGQRTLTTMGLDDLLDRIGHDTAEGYILQFREIQHTLLGEPSYYNHYEQILDVCPACEWSRLRNGSMVVKAYNGLVTLEIGPLGNPLEVEEAKRQASLLPQTMVAMEGYDSHSVIVLASAVRPDQTLPAEDEAMRLFHAQAYRIAVQCYAPTLTKNLQLREPCLDATFKMTVDVRPFLNPHAIPFIVEQPTRDEVVWILPRDPDENPLGLARPEDGGVGMDEIYGACCAQVYTEADWVRLGENPVLAATAISTRCAEVGLPEEEVTRRLQGRYYRHDRQAIRAAVHNVYLSMNPQSLNPLKVMPKKQVAALMLREFLKRRYEIRYNEVLGTTEYRQRHHLDFMFHELTRRDRNTIRHEAALEGIEAFDSEVSGLIDSNFTPRYNPVDAWLDELPRWDGRDRLTELARLVPTQNEHWERLFRRWMLSMVAHWMGYDPEHGNSTAPILIGAQGYRKSTFCRILLPPELRAFFTDSLDFRNATEAERYLGRFLLVNIDEFDQLTDNQFAFIKHLFQKPVVSLRRSYSTVIAQQRRYASFIGTSNQPEILRDPTGNRRFFCVEVTAPIRVETPIDYGQLYAQVLELIRQGERYWIDDEDEALIREMDRAYEVESPLESLVRDVVSVPAEGQGTWKTATEIMQLVQKHPLYRREMNNLRRLGRILTKMGFEKMHGMKGNAYWVNML